MRTSPLPRLNRPDFGLYSGHTVERDLKPLCLNRPDFGLYSGLSGLPAELKPVLTGLTSAYIPDLQKILAATQVVS